MDCRDRRRTERDRRTDRNRSRALRGRLAAPGKVYPIIHPARDGQAPTVRILYAGNASPRARIDISYKEKGTERPTRVSRDLTKIDTSAPIVVRETVTGDRVTEIDLQTD